MPPRGQQPGRAERPESLHEQVARNLRNDIAAGVLRHGQSLPSSRELAARWGVSPFTITEAMKILAAENLVISKARANRVINAPDQVYRNEVRTNAPQVVLIGGYAGSGKTELGRILARETGWPILDKDTLTRPVVEYALQTLGHSPNDRESQEYVTLIRPREYEALAAATTENVQCGNSAIVTAPFIREFRDEAWLSRMRATCESMHAEMTVVWLYCDASTMLTYVRHRGAARDAAKLDDWERYLLSIDLSFRPTGPHIVIDNCSSGEPIQAQAKNLLQSILANSTR
ncbi:MAG: GntR family transcriptional regulator [Dehalococcoidia bacterium]